MKILFYDTETAGFEPQAIVQFGGILGEYSEDGSEVISEEKIDLMFNPMVPIHKSASDIHGFTDDMVKLSPSFTLFMKRFVEIVNEVDCVVGHNINFDNLAIQFEFERAFGKEEKILNFIKKLREKSFCTMLSSIDFCGIPGKYGKNKWPKLLELHKKLFGVEFDCAHNAMADIEATRSCYFGLKKLNIIK